MATTGAIGGAVPSTTAADSLPTETDGDSVSMLVASLSSTAFQETDDENETVRHQNPDTYSEDDGDDELDQWLSSWLTGQLEESAIEISEGQYETANEYIDDEFEDRLGQYVAVAGETDGDESEAYEEAQQDQQNLSDSVAEYEETQDKYEAAREDGDDERARELARELGELSEEIGDLSQSIQSHYDVIAEATGTDLTTAIAAVEATNQSIQTDQEQIREAEFDETTIRITAVESTTVSFTTPLTATGEIETADGTPVADEPIRLNVGNQLLETETDDSGEFEFDYRPISIPAGETDLTVNYLPDSGSPYFGSETSIGIDVEQVEPTLTITSVDPETVAYNDTLGLEAELRAGEQEIDDVPLTVTLGEQDLGVASLNADDLVFDGAGTVPAAVPSGEQNLTVSLPFEARALESVTSETTITVTETETELSVAATQSKTNEDELNVTGDFTAAGSGVEGQSIQIAIDGTSFETVTTEGSGEFETTIAVPEDATGELEVTAVYSGDGTNLASAEATTAVSLPSASSSSSWLWLAGGGVLFVGIIGVGGGLYWYRSQQPAESPPSHRRDESPDIEEPTPSVDSEPAAESGSSLVQPLFSEATDRLDEGDTEGAVQTCYAAVRQSLESELDSAQATGYTYWEFYRLFESETDTSAITDSLRTVTQGYEQATFDVSGVSKHEAETILEHARNLCQKAESVPHN
ncbi:hypothetical protein C482_20226 [Natrialba chahannaoensis JCM 10990]|uniref:DUF4129 domain-containing protein n=1 Tax=Natrialba chahannaoensis JCM 10990 TaxID=1227492 RepID=M0A6U2_9EURY|nr:Ig-like domain-containing protein [Natrialba chahannaoensis]ELY93038.1 hypothetical protein C482_20226 [Natrialba chahannaoensis JCM 10990]